MSIFAAIAELEAKNKPGALCTVILTSGSTPRHEGSKMLVYPDGTFVGTVGGGEIENQVRMEAGYSIRDGKTRIKKYSLVDPSRGDVGVCGGTVEVFIEPILPVEKLIVVGAGHVGKAVVYLAHWLGFHVIVSDDREEYCTPEANPNADEVISCSMKEIPSRVEINPQTYIVLTTRGSDVDMDGLGELLNSSAAYIGVIGSKRRWLTTRKGLEDAGVSPEKLDVVHSPIGLELQAETPEEIALSIMAEILMKKNQANGKSMKI